MEDYIKEIEKKLKSKINFEKLEIINNSHKHKGHKFFSAKKFYLHLKINSQELNSLSRINAQKTIMNILKDDLEAKIHALEITFKNEI